VEQAVHAVINNNQRGASGFASAAREPIQVLLSNFPADTDLRNVLERFHWRGGQFSSELDSNQREEFKRQINLWYRAIGRQRVSTPATATNPEFRRPADGAQSTNAEDSVPSERERDGSNTDDTGTPSQEPITLPEYTEEYSTAPYDIYLQLRAQNVVSTPATTDPELNLSSAVGLSLCETGSVLPLTSPEGATDVVATTGTQVLNYTHVDGEERGRPLDQIRIPAVLCHQGVYSAIHIRTISTTTESKYIPFVERNTLGRRLSALKHQLSSVLQAEDDVIRSIDNLAAQVESCQLPDTYVNGGQPYPNHPFPDQLSGWKKIGVTGTSQSGKSSLLNALLHCPGQTDAILPTGANLAACTSFPMEIVSRQDHPDRFFITVQRMDKQEYLDKIESFRSLPNVQDEDDKLRDAWTHRFIRIHGGPLTNGLPTEDQVEELFRTPVPALYTTNYAGLKTMISQISGQPPNNSIPVTPLEKKHRDLIKKIRIEGPFTRLPPGVMLIDVPGFNDVTGAIRMRVAEEALHMCTHFLVVVHKFGLDAVDMLRRVIPSSTNPNNIITALTKADDAKSWEEEYGDDEDVIRSHYLSLAKDQIRYGHAMMSEHRFPPAIVVSTTSRGYSTIIRKGVYVNNSLILNHVELTGIPQLQRFLFYQPFIQLYNVLDQAYLDTNEALEAIRQTVNGTYRLPDYSGSLRTIQEAFLMRARIYRRAEAFSQRIDEPDRAERLSLSIGPPLWGSIHGQVWMAIARRGGIYTNRDGTYDLFSDIATVLSNQLTQEAVTCFREIGYFVGLLNNLPPNLRSDPVINNLINELSSFSATPFLIQSLYGYAQQIMNEDYIGYIGHEKNQMAERIIQQALDGYNQYLQDFMRTFSEVPRQVAETIDNVRTRHTDSHRHPQAGLILPMISIDGNNMDNLMAQLEAMRLNSTTVQQP